MRRLSEVPSPCFLPALLVLMLLASAPDSPAAAASDGTPTASSAAVALLDRASRRLAETESVHFELEVEGDTFLDAEGNIRLLEAEGDLQRPDRVRTSFRVQVLRQNVTLQLITVGDRSWTTNLLTGEWEPAPVEFAYRPSVLFDNQAGIGPVMGRVEDVHQLDDEEVAGRAAYHLRASVAEEVIGPLTYETMLGSPVTVDLWIDRETDDLLRARLTEPPSAGRENPATWTLDLSDHGDQVTIEAPV